MFSFCVKGYEIINYTYKQNYVFICNDAFNISKVCYNILIYNPN